MGVLKVAKFFFGRLSDGKKVAVHLRGDGLMDVIMWRGIKTAELGADDLGSNVIRSIRRYDLAPPKGTKLKPGWEIIDDRRVLDAGTENFRIMSHTGNEQMGSLRIGRNGESHMELDLGQLGRAHGQQNIAKGAHAKEWGDYVKKQANTLARMGQKVGLAEGASAEVRKMMMSNAVMSMPF